MCSIIGYYGKGPAAPILVKGLKRMEYRGYDSVGVATKSDHKIEIRKGVGKVTEVNNSVNLDKLPGSIGIGHTRWATHGKVTKVNAHPHQSNSGKVVIVHNGNIVFIDSSGMQISDFDGRPVKHQVTKVSKEFADAYKGDYAHFTLKEISEQPETLLRAGDKTQSAIEQTADFI